MNIIVVLSALAAVAYSAPTDSQELNAKTILSTSHSSESQSQDRSPQFGFGSILPQQQFISRPSLGVVPVLSSGINPGFNGFQQGLIGSSFLGRSTLPLKKPIITKDKQNRSGEKDAASSGEKCSQDCKERSSDEAEKQAQELTMSSESAGVESDILFAKEAIEQLKKNINNMEMRAGAHWKHGTNEDDKEMHKSIESAKKALEDVQAKFGRLESRALMEANDVPAKEGGDKMNEAERLAQWKDAMDNVQNNLGKSIDEGSKSAEEAEQPKTADKQEQPKMNKDDMDSAASENKDNVAALPQKDSRNTDDNMEPNMKTVIPEVEDLENTQKNANEENLEPNPEAIAAQESEPKETQLQREAEIPLPETTEEPASTEIPSMKEAENVNVDPIDQQNIASSQPEEVSAKNAAKDELTPESNEAKKVPDNLSIEQPRPRMKITVQAPVKPKEANNDNINQELMEPAQPDARVVQAKEVQQQPMNEIVEATPSPVTPQAKAAIDDMTQASSNVEAVVQPKQPNTEAIVPAARSVFNEKARSTEEPNQELSGPLPKAQKSADVMRNHEMGHQPESQALLDKFRQWQQQELSRSAYGPSIPSHNAGAQGGNAIGVFPNAHVGGCAIPLLLSCSPSVVKGTLAKAHPASSYASNYKNVGESSIHNKRDTRIINGLRTKTKRAPVSKYPMNRRY